MLEKLLYLVNFESYDIDLVRCLTRLKDVGCQELVLAHILRPEEALHHIPPLLRDDLRRCLSEVAHQKLAEFATICQAVGITACPIVKTGDLAWLEIRQLVVQEGIALLVVGPRVGPRLDATVNFLMSGSRTPLLIVKVPEKIAQAPYATICQSLFGRVLYPTDWSPCSQKALTYIVRLRPLGISDVTVVHVVEPQTAAELSKGERASYAENVAQQLAETQRTLEAAGLRASTQVLKGDPGRELVRLATQEQIALIVMGATGKGMAAEMALGSVSGQVARTTDRSILLIY